MEIFPFLPTINFFEEGKMLLAVTSLEATNSVFLTGIISSFSITKQIVGFLEVARKLLIN